MMPTYGAPGGRSRNTFVVRILHTEDKEWVGIVSHVQSGRKTSFRGFIEAVRFIDGFVGGNSVRPAGESGSRRRRPPNRSAAQPGDPSF